MSITTRYKWARAALEVSRSRNDSVTYTIKHMFIAFRLAPVLDMDSSIEKFKSAFKE